MAQIKAGYLGGDPGKTNRVSPARGLRIPARTLRRRSGAFFTGSD